LFSYSICSGVDAVFCGKECRNEEHDSTQKVEVIGCYGSIEKTTFQHWFDQTEVHGEHTLPFVMCIYVIICDAESKSLFAAAVIN